MAGGESDLPFITASFQLPSCVTSHSAAFYYSCVYLMAGFICRVCGEEGGEGRAEGKLL